MTLSVDLLKKELTFRTSRSGGAGGQHVNKVETKVTLIWDFEASQLISAEQKAIIAQTFSSRINADGHIQLDASETRSQVTNKQLAIDKLIALLSLALRPSKKRIKTKIPRAVVLNRLERKKKQATKKADRRWKMD